MACSTSKPRGEKPRKPHQDFPLYPHASGRWCKRIKGKLHYFGPWWDPHAALAKWLAQKDDLLAGRRPRPTGEGVTLMFLCNHFLTSFSSRAQHACLSQGQGRTVVVR